MNSVKARERAEKSFRKEERAQDGRKAMIEYESQARATREKTARFPVTRGDFASWSGKTISCSAPSPLIKVSWTT